MQIFIENKANSDINLSEADFKKVAIEVLKLKGQPVEDVALSLYLVGAEEIREVNREYRSKDKSTDVITFRLIETENGKTLTRENFPLDYDPSLGFYLGEIFICLDVAKTQSVEMGHSEAREVLELFVHAMLHILGHDHEREAEALVMKKLEEAMYPVLDELVR